MANGHGGHRTPAHPAPVSGPGALSRRTDGRQPIRVQNDQEYGDRKASIGQQRAAPLPQQTEAAPMDLPQSATPYSAVPFGAATQRPGEPITHGVDIGDGGGPEVLGIPGQGPMPTGYITNMLQQLSATDTTGTLGKLYLIAKQRNV